MTAQVGGSEMALVAVIGAVVGGLVTATPLIINLFKTRAETRRAARADAIAEWQAIVDRQQKEIDTLKEQLQATNSRVYDSVRAEGECREKVARQEGLIQALTSDVRRLQVITRDSHPSVTSPAMVTATAEDGIIRVASPAVGPMFGWLPAELIGKKIEVLVPPESVAKHTAALAEVVAGRRKVDPAKSLYVEALHRNGRRVPVCVNMVQWTSPRGQVFVNAEIRETPAEFALPRERADQP